MFGGRDIFSWIDCPQQLSHTMRIHFFQFEIISFEPEPIEKVTEFWASMGVVILLKGYCMIIKIKQIEHFSLIFQLVKRMVLFYIFENKSCIGEKNSSLLLTTKKIYNVENSKSDLKQNNV